uniref:Uncharacterized protein n=1 Tax=Urocitellus parryii TaxID=9999 RepID=A0A8D2HB23_UROPR
MPKFYCNYRDADPTRDSSSVRRHTTGEGNTKGMLEVSYQKLMEEMAGRQNSSCIQQRRTPPTLASVSPPAGAMIQLPPGPPIPPHSDSDGPSSPGMIPVGPTSGMRSLVCLHARACLPPAPGSHYPTCPCNPAPLDFFWMEFSKK